MGSIIKFRKNKIYEGDDKMTKTQKSKIEDIGKRKKEEIEKITSKLLKNVSFKDSPYVDIVSLVKKDNFMVKPEEMDIETTGCLFVGDNFRIILVNTIFKNPENESDVVFKKSRFITAHEYGHFIMHKKKGEPIYAHRDSYHRTEPLELEADYFARSILMPLGEFKTYYYMLNNISNDEKFTIDLLSQIFKVTKNKIKKRIGDLSVLA